MRTRTILLAVISLAMVMAGCKKTSVNVDEGYGTIIYDNHTLDLNLSTIATSEMQDGTYSHALIFSNTKTDNLISFRIKDDNATLETGTYTIHATGDNNGHFSINLPGQNISDAVAGTLTVSYSNSNHTFHFTGSTADENTAIKTVRLSYSGKLKSK